MSNICHFNSTCPFIIDVSEIKLVTYRTKINDYFLVIEFNNGDKRDIHCSKVIEAMKTIAKSMKEYHKEKSIHKQYKPDGAGYIEAKTEFETLNNKTE